MDGGLILVGYPLLVLMQNLVHHQTIYGNHPMYVRWLSHRYVLGQSLSFFQNEFAGRVATKVMQTAQAVRDVMDKLVGAIVYVSVYFIGAVVLVALADLILVLPLLGWLAGYIAIIVFFVPRMRKLSMAQADARAKLTGRVVDSYTNIQTVKLFAHARREQDYAREAMVEFMGTVHPMFRLVSRLNVYLELLNSSLLAGITGFAIYAWLQSWISLGVIAVAISLVLRLRSTSQWIVWEVAGLFEQIGVVQDGINTIAQARAVGGRPAGGRRARGDARRDPLRGGPLPLWPRQGGDRGPVARDQAGREGRPRGAFGRGQVDARQPPPPVLRRGGGPRPDRRAGHRRGHAGEPPRRDRLCHPGHLAPPPLDPRQHPLRSSRRVRGGRGRGGAARAHADEFIRGVSDPQGRTGYDAHVGERGVKLSGGQRQRVAIARVFLKNAPILVLDEATSSLDSEVEAAIQEHLMTLMEGKTVIAIAHRLSTIATLDRLIVMDRGRIIESGAHHELLQRGGLYADLWRRQSGGFLDAIRDEAAE